MPWNGLGQYLLPPAFTPETNGTVIDAVRYNGTTSDLANGISQAWNKNGENVPTHNMPMGNFKFTGLLAGTGAGDSVAFGQDVTFGIATLTTVNVSGVLTAATITGHSSLDLALAGGTMTGQIISTVTEPLRLTNNGVFISGYNAAGTTRTGFIQFAAGVGVALTADTAIPMTFSTTALERMRIDAIGNVGIGAVAPVSFGGSYRTLEIQGGSVANGGILQLSNSDKSLTGRLVVDNTGSGLTFVTSAAMPISFAPVGTIRMTLDVSGNLGIGIIPTYRLDVLSASTIPARFRSSGALTAVMLADSATTVDTLYIGSVGNDFRVVTNSVEKFRISAAGEIGINTTPIASVPLRIQQAGTTDTGFEIVRFTSTSSGIQSFNRNTLAYNTFRVDAANVFFNVGTPATVSGLTINPAGVVDLPQGSGKLTMAGTPTFADPANQALAGGTTTYVFTHGSNRVPATVYVYYRCTAAINGYAIGDEGTSIAVTGTGLTTSDASATQVTVIQNTNPTMLSKTTGALFIPTSANFTIGVKCLWL